MLGASPPPRSVSASPEADALPQIASSSTEEQPPRRTSSSFNRFLRRQKSGDVRPPANRSPSSSSKLSKKQKAALAQDELARQEREAAAATKQPPRLPSHPPLPKIHSFGADDRPDSVAIISNQLRGYSQAGNYSRPSTDYKMSSSPPHGVPVPPIPGSSPSTRNGEYIDPYSRTESMTHRGRYSYASSAVSAVNSPRRVRRRKDPTPFNILVVGAKGSGKTSFIKFLQTSLKLPSKKRPKDTPSPPRTALPPDSPFSCEYIEGEVDGERIGLTLWDSQGLEKNVVDLQLREMSAFLESKFEETFTEEQKVVRAPGVRDTHIHCVFLILDPSRLTANIATAEHADVCATYKFNSHQRFIGILDDDFDLQVLRTLQGKTTVIPVISKADTITTAHMTHLKKSVWNSLKEAKLDPLEALELGDSDSEDADRFDERDEDDYAHSSDSDEKVNVPGKFSDPSSDDGHSDNSLTDLSSSPRNGSPNPSEALPVNKVRPAAGHRRTASAMSARLASAEADEVRYLPFSIISPDTYEPGVIGRRFPWGFADPYNAEHCDFVRLKESVFGEWRAELREASRDRYYEGWRTSRLKRTPRKTPVKLTAKDSDINGVSVGKAISPSPYASNLQGSPEVPRQLYRGVAAYQ